MNAIERRLLEWAERRLQLDDLTTTIEELAGDRRDAHGSRAAARWTRREVVRAAARALATRPPAGSDRNLIEVILRETRFALRRVRRLPGHALSFAMIVGTGIGIAVFMAETRSHVLAPDDGVRADAPRVTWVTDQGVPRPTIALTGSEAWLRPSDAPFRTLTAIWPSARVLETPTGLLRVTGQRVLPGYLAALEARPRIGRGPTGPDEVLLSHRLWTERFDADAEVLGRTVRMDDQPVRVVGVAPPEFHGPICCVPPDSWLATDATVEPRPAQLFVIEPTDDGAASAWLERSTRASDPLRRPGRATLRHPTAAPFGGERGFVGLILAVLLGLAGTVWATTLLSGANLIVSDTLARRGELRLRTALGARSTETWIRITCEAGVLAALSAAAALAFTAAFTSLAPWLLPIIGGNTTVRVAVGGRTLCLAAAAGALSALFAALPAVLVALRVGASSRLQRGPANSRFAAVGLAVQVALASTLVIVTGLFVGSLRTLDGAFVGFRHGETAVHFLSPAADGVAPPVRLVLDAVDGRAALTARLPVYGARWDTVSTGSGDRVEVAVESVTAGFFDVIGSTLVSGDPARTPTEAVVSRDLAEAFGWGEGATGSTLMLADTLALRVTGVVEAATWGTGDDRPTVYRGFPDTVSNAVLLARGSTATASVLLPALRPLSVALRPFDTLDGLHVRSRVLQVFLARLALVFGAVALLVAVGAVHSHFLRWVRARERDMAIRRALGAPLPRLGRSLLTRALLHIVPGAVLGVALGVAAARGLAGIVGAASGVGLGLLVGTGGILAVATLLALVGPIHRAGHIQPMSVLRHD